MAFAGRKVKATKLTGQVVLKEGTVEGTYVGTYSGSWGKEAGMSAAGNVEGVFEEGKLTLKVTTPGVGHFTAELKPGGNSEKWEGAWHNPTGDGGDFNLTMQKTKAPAKK